jgi:hypothetical protein
MGMIVSDERGSDDSSRNESRMLFFPRAVMPAIQFIGDKQIVTLPTGEQVQFDPKTKTILPGDTVMKEGPWGRGGPPTVTYTGTGVLVRLESKGPKFNSKATISKNGKTCQVDAARLFQYSQEKDQPPFFTKFRFPTDAAFSRFLGTVPNCQGISL